MTAPVTSPVEWVEMLVGDVVTNVLAAASHDHRPRSARAYLYGVRVLLNGYREGDS